MATTTTHNMNPTFAGHARETSRTSATHAYRNLAVMGGIHLVIMYLVMFAMIDTIGDFVNNLNMLYMALMMAAPMILIMPLMMSKMYPDRFLNRMIMGVSALVFLGAFALIREQGVIGDRQLIASMIPHHSGAILMCRRASLADPELTELCRRIEDTQRTEIEQMRAIGQRL